MSEGASAEAEGATIFVLTLLLIATIITFNIVSLVFNAVGLTLNSERLFPNAMQREEASYGLTALRPI